ncbi:RING finger protein 208 isoform X1 [Macaca thibetana thibetana]|uniref:RING finger protein 208 isoform X1 n=1 Tax=Macaca mulatta TaxID=9544 RepID=UPI0010A2213B|nr:RING finger protein 208 isoform X1 [Macaca mulatta]XP_045230008.1 RING finger protein 208 isoform X1 [Macaca fascicularis]XP_050616236.1 RING finger protein 208 isoform X1 [Macaca thibetana thibetana]
MGRGAGAGTGGLWNQLPWDPPRRSPPSPSSVLRPPSVREENSRIPLLNLEAGGLTRTQGQPGKNWGRRGGPAPHAVRQRGRRRERTEGRPGGWPRPADPARVPRRGVALRARAGAARTAVPAPPPQSAPRSARTCRRRRRAETRAPRPRPRPSVPPGPCHRLRSLRPPREPPEPPKLPGQDAGAASGPAFETTSAAAARGRDARLGQLRPGPGLASAPAAEPAARVLLQPALRLAAFPGRPVLEPWGPPSPCLPRCPGPRPADLGYRGSPPRAPSPASAARDPG